MKKLIFTGIVLSFVTCIQAQDFVDNALLFSRSDSRGSARVQALGGAATALGGDYSAALANPAGLGMYNRSEFTITPGLNFSNVNSHYFGTTTADTRAAFNVPGLSIVINKPSGKDRGFIGGSLAITLSRTNELNQNYTISGQNDESSMIDYFMWDAGDIHPDELLYDGSYFYSLTGLAYGNYLIEDREDNGDFFYDSRLLYTESRQREIAQRKGAQYQWSIAYGANFSDKFFAGATLGITSLRYKLQLGYDELNPVYPSGADQALDYFHVSEEYDIRGSGVNFTVGGIYRPFDFVQIGASIVTPTFHNITDTYRARIESDWNNYDYYPDDTDDDNLNFVYEEFDRPLVSEYNMTTPMRFNTGVTFISKIGFITADLEFINHARARYNPDIEADFSGENDAILSEYQSVINYRLGAEYRLKEFRFRGGANYLSSAISRDDESDRAVLGFSGGLGYRMKTFFADFAAVFSSTNGQRVLYTFGGPDPVADFDIRNQRYLLTLGFIF